MSPRDTPAPPDELLGLGGEWDETFQALSDPRRRDVVGYLLESGEATLSELGDVVTGCLATREGEAGTPSRREGVVLELHHWHLPLLDDSGLVRYDVDRGVASLGPVARDNREALQSLFEVAAGPTVKPERGPGDERDAGR